MLTIKYQSAFKKDYKRIKKRGYDTRLLEKVVACWQRVKASRQNTETTP